jgi:hypothetical protein
VLDANLQLASNDLRTRLPYFNTALFSRETVGQIGTYDTRMFHGPAINNPSSSVTNANCANMTSARSARVDRLALKYYF